MAAWRVAGAVLMITFITLNTVIAQDPIVIIKDSDPIAKDQIVLAQRDQDVTMSCFVDYKQSNIQVRWQYYYFDADKNLQMKKISTDTSVEDNTKHSIEQPTFSTWKLRIKSVQMSDAGNYTCFVYLTRSSQKHDNMTLAVLVPPMLNRQVSSSDIVVKQDDDKDLICNATGIPQPTIEWTRMGGALLPIGKERHYGPILSLLNIRPEDRGKYRCRVYNIIGHIEHTVVLDVKFKPIITPMYEVVSQAPGYVIELQCYIEANPMPSSEQLRWMKDNIAYSYSSGKYKVKRIVGAFNQLTYELRINGVEEEDYGDFYCQSRIAGEIVSRTVKLERSDSPRPSLKLGKIIKGKASALQVSFASILLTSVLSFILLH